MRDGRWEVNLGQITREAYVAMQKRRDEQKGGLSPHSRRYMNSG